MVYCCLGAIKLKSESQVNLKTHMTHRYCWTRQNRFFFFHFIIFLLESNISFCILYSMTGFILFFHFLANFRLETTTPQRFQLYKEMILLWPNQLFATTRHGCTVLFGSEQRSHPPVDYLSIASFIMKNKVSSSFS